MTRLFIHAYLDEDVDVLVAKLLRSRQFDATTTIDAGQAGREDEEQLQFATDRGMCVVTRNRSDFEELAGKWYAAGRSHAGIVIAVRRRPEQIAGRLSQLMDNVTADEIIGEIMYI